MTVDTKIGVWSLLRLKRKSQLLSDSGRALSHVLPLHLQSLEGLMIVVHDKCHDKFDILMLES